MGMIYRSSRVERLNLSALRISLGSPGWVRVFLVGNNMSKGVTGSKVWQVGKLSAGNWLLEGGQRGNRW